MYTITPIVCDTVMTFRGVYPAGIFTQIGQKYDMVHTTFIVTKFWKQSPNCNNGINKKMNNYSHNKLIYTLENKCITNKNNNTDQS